MKLVLDTNVLVSAMVSSEKPPGQIVHLIGIKQVKAYTTPHLWFEFLKVIGYPKVQKLLKRYERLEMVDKIISDLYVIVNQVPAIPPFQNWIPRDNTDNWVIQCAITAKADYIISGDKDLTSLGGSVEGIPIMTPSEFLQVFHQQNN